MQRRAFSLIFLGIIVLISIGITTATSVSIGGNAADLCEELLSGETDFSLTITNPVGGEYWSGVQPITWTPVGEAVSDITAESTIGSSESCTIDTSETAAESTSDVIAGPIIESDTEDFTASINIYLSSSNFEILDFPILNSLTPIAEGIEDSGLYMWDIGDIAEGRYKIVIEREIKVWEVVCETIIEESNRITITQHCDHDDVCELEDGETTENCPDDCPPADTVCDNDGICEPEHGENSVNCPFDCKPDDTREKSGCNEENNPCGGIGADACARNNICDEAKYSDICAENCNCCPDYCSCPHETHCEDGNGPEANGCHPGCEDNSDCKDPKGENIKCKDGKCVPAEPCTQDWQCANVCGTENFKGYVWDGQCNDGACDWIPRKCRFECEEQAWGEEDCSVGKWCNGAWIKVVCTYGGSKICVEKAGCVAPNKDCKEACGCCWFGPNCCRAEDWGLVDCQEQDSWISPEYCKYAGTEPEEPEG